MDDESLVDVPCAERRQRLQAALAGTRPPIYLTGITEDAATAH